MKSCKKTFILFAVFFLLVTLPVFSVSFSIEDLSAKADSFSETMARSLPFNSTIGLNWSNAYIGKFFPSIPPHFGVGITAGFTTMPIGSISELASMFDFNLPPLPAGFILPAYTMEARLGGLFLPFDVGVKFGILPETNMLQSMTGMGLKYQLIGADIRYSLVDIKLLPIKVSLGMGFNRLEGGVSTSLPGGPLNFNFGSNTLNVPAPDLNLIWETNVIEFKAQVSFPLIIVTPYAGAGVSYAWSKVGYQVKSDITINGGSIDSHIDELKSMGITGINADGFERIVNVEGLNARLFAGVSLNIALIRFDLTAMVNAMDGSMGGSLGIRFQL